MFNSLENSTNLQAHRGNLQTDSTCSLSSRCQKDLGDKTDTVCFSNVPLQRGVDYCGAKMDNAPHNMAKKINRFNSFKRSQWIKYMVDPEALSDVGFYYTGVDDKVKCFSCGGVVGDWNFTDNPWEEHAFWFPHCDFVQQEKGPLFVASVKKRWGQHLKILDRNKQTDGFCSSF